MGLNYKNLYKNSSNLNQLHFKRWEILSFKSSRMDAIKELLKMINLRNLVNSTNQQKFLKKSNENVIKNPSILIHYLYFFNL